MLNITVIFGINPCLNPLLVCLSLGRVANAIGQKKMLENVCVCGSIDIALDEMTTNLKNAILISPSKFTVFSRLLVENVFLLYLSGTKVSDIL